MSQKLVGTKTVTCHDDLRSLIYKLVDNQPCYYFLRWAHRVSGIVSTLEEFPSPEGQVFSKQFELRWKQSHKGYDVLLLHCNQSVTDLEFDAVAEHWIVSPPLGFPPLGAYLYDRDETRFPKGLNYPKGCQLRQRYFQDSQTETVHFVALTLAN